MITISFLKHTYRHLKYLILPYMIYLILDMVKCSENFLKKTISSLRSTFPFSLLFLLSCLRKTILPLIFTGTKFCCQWQVDSVNIIEVHWFHKISQSDNLLYVISPAIFLQIQFRIVQVMILIVNNVFGVLRTKSVI